MTVNPGFGGQSFHRAAAQEDRAHPRDDRLYRARHRSRGRRRRRPRRPRRCASPRAPTRWSRAPRHSRAARTPTPPTSPRCVGPERDDRRPPDRARLARARHRLGPADGIEPGRRLIRVGDDRGASLAERVAARFHRLTWGTPLHSLRLRGRFPLKLLGVPRDPIAGDRETGLDILDGEIGSGRARTDTATLDFAAPRPLGGLRRLSAKLRLAARSGGLGAARRSRARPPRR